MTEENSAGDERRILYCVVPSDLADVLHDELRRFYREAGLGVAVVVEQRRRERRRRSRRVHAAEAAENRRTIRNDDGRRIADRRTPALLADPVPLPAIAEEHRERLRFFERIEQSEQRRQDVDTARLVTRIQSGDRAATSELYLRFFDGVYTYLRAALKSPHDAEDATQEVFLKAIKALPRYRFVPGTPFRAWLFRIARNEAVSKLRRDRLLDVEDPIEIGRRQDVRFGADVGEALDWVSNADLISLLERMPVTQRQVVVLRYMLDLSTPEICTVLDRSPEAVRQLEFRSRKFLEGRLAVLQGRELRRRRNEMRRRAPLMPVVRERRAALTYAGLPMLGRTRWR